MTRRFFITTPIYYVNSHPHLGHLFSTLVCDTLARYKRQQGYEVFFLTGTDEHGINIERAAAARGLPPPRFVDEIAAEFKEMVKRFGLLPNLFIRTSDDYHKRGAQELWRRVRENGHLYKGFYEGWFCAPCAAFKTEDEYQPAPSAGDPPLCLMHDRPLDRVSEESYFFKLSAMRDRLLELYESQPDFVRPASRRNEVMSFVRGGLQDLSVSRTSVKWGIPVPDDPAHTMYVWMDALSNYITALGFGNDGAHLAGAASGGIHPQTALQDFWPVAHHIIGKDILRFHAVYWPAFLLAAGLNPPKGVYAHGYWLSGGRRMSKTLGNVIDLNVLDRHFSNDMVRYFCLREMVFGQDSDFTYGALIDRTNSDLADGLGNLVSRHVAMIKKYCDGVVPAGTLDPLDEAGRRLLGGLEETAQAFRNEFDQFNFSRALEGAWGLIAETDKYISDSKPWELAKDPGKRDRLTDLLNLVSRSLWALARLLYPVLPESADRIRQVLGVSGTVEEYDPAQIRKDDNLAGNVTGLLAPLFPKIDKEKKMDEINSAVPPAPSTPATEPAAPQAPEPGPVEPLAPKAYIGIEDFAKIELRVGTVLTAEKVEKADKLLRLTIDMNEAEPRQVLAGIAQYYTPEQMVGRKVVVVANLMPRKMRGYESNGMILAASIGDEGRPVLAGFLEDVPNGAKLK